MIRSLILVSVVAGPLVGCTNEPGALKMILTVDQSEFRVGQPVLLHATLETADARVCLARTRYYKTTMRVISHDAKESEALKSSDPFVCGTWLVVGWPVYPALLAGAWLDVGDLLGRFDVMKPNDVRRDVLEISPSPEHWNPNLLDVRRSREPTGAMSAQSWSPGQYELEVRLVNQHLGFMPPLFWKPYSHRLEGTVRVTIVEADDEEHQAEQSNK